MRVGGELGGMGGVGGVGAGGGGVIVWGMRTQSNEQKSDQSPNDTPNDGTNISAAAATVSTVCVRGGGFRQHRTTLTCAHQTDLIHAQACAQRVRVGDELRS